MVLTFSVFTLLDILTTDNMTQNNPHNEMPKDTVEEILATLEKSLEEKFNKVVKALIQNINGTFSEGERKDICNKLNQDGINEIRDALTTAYNQEAYARGYKQGRFDAEMDILNEDRNARAREVVQRIMPWVEHDNQCILQRCERGEPTEDGGYRTCLLYTSPSPRDRTRSRMPSSA